MKKDEFLKVCRKNAKKELTQEEESFFSTIGEGIENAMALETTARNKQIEENLAKLVGSFDEGETVSGVVRSMAQKIDVLEEKTKRNFTNEDKFKLKSLLLDKKDEIIRAKESGQNWKIEFKAKRAASALMTTSTVLSGATAINTMNYMDDMEVLVIQYPKNFIIDAVGGRQVANVPAVLRWKEQNTESTDATGLTLEGAVKPLTDKSFVWKTANRAKYAGRIEFTEELTMDFDQLLLQIIDMFEQQVIRSWNAAVQVLIVAYCSAYTSTELDGTFVLPQTSQVIQAGKLWIENSLYEPDIVMIRPGDAALALIQQNNDGDIKYLPEAVAFHGLTPFVSTNVPEGKIIIGSSRTISEQHSNFIIRRGTYGDQFIENEETIVGEVFSLLKLPTISKASWLVLDIATVKASLSKAV